MMPKRGYEPPDLGDVAQANVGTIVAGGSDQLQHALNFNILLRELDISSRLNEVSSAIFQQLQPGQRVLLAVEIERSPEVRVMAVAISPVRAFAQLETDSGPHFSNPTLFNRDNWQGTTLQAIELRKPRSDEGTKCLVDELKPQPTTLNFSIIERHAPSEVRRLSIPPKSLGKSDLAVEQYAMRTELRKVDKPLELPKQLREETLKTATGRKSKHLP